MIMDPFVMPYFVFNQVLMLKKNLITKEGKSVHTWTVYVGCKPNTL